MRYTLDEHVRRDPRIMEVYRNARRLYTKDRFYHHSMEHVSRDLNRALVIAEDEGTADYGVLIPSVLLHDIGFNDPDYIKLGHDVTGARMAEVVLKPLGYQEAVSDRIRHCILAHKGKAEIPGTLEAKILYDADVLEKAGLVYLILSGKIICEFGESIDDLLRRESRDRAAEVERGFYTKKARELDGGRLEQVAMLLHKIREEISEGRRDYAVSEADLWIHPPEDMT